MNQLISIILPCFNSEKTIVSTINSVIAQSYQNWELLVIDDRSTDSTVDNIHKNFDSDQRIKVITLEKNTGGPAGPRNIGLKNSHGDIICFLDADDLWHSEKLHTQYSFLLDSGYKFISSSRSVFTNDMEKNLDLSQPLNDDPKFIEIDHNQLIRKNIISNSSVMVFRSVIDQLRFDESRRYIALEDYLLWLNIHQKNISSSVKLELPLLFYRISREGISNQKLQMLKKVYHLLSTYKVEDKNLGIKKYIYFFNYIYESFRNLFYSKFLQKNL